MEGNTFTELVEAINSNIEGLEAVGDRYNEAGLQNLRNILYCLDRIQLLTDELVKRTEKSIADLI